MCSPLFVVSIGRIDKLSAVFKIKKYIEVYIANLKKNGKEIDNSKNTKRCAPCVR